MANLLEVRNLTTHFFTQDGVVKAVNNVSFDIAAGETVALVGESGCGKTVSSLSIVRLIQEPPGRIVGGQIFFNGTDLLKLSKSEIHKVRGSQISMIFQEPLTSLNPVLTVGLQLTEAMEEHLKLEREDAEKRAVELLEAVGIPHANRRIKNYPHHFSGGMRQRVMIAIAISCKPQLIIADEPTTAVDVTVQAQLLELIRNITRELNTSLILITHNLGIVARYANRVYVMYAGRIIEHGTSRELFQNPLHPYTVGLLDSIPRLNEAKKTRLEPISGQPPDLISLPQGCAFADRCAYAEPYCKTNNVELKEANTAHYTACLRVQNGSMTWKKT